MFVYSQRGLSQKSPGLKSAAKLPKSARKPVVYPAKSEARKRDWADPEKRKRHIEGLKAAWADPAIRKRIVSGMQPAAKWGKPSARSAARAGSTSRPAAAHE